MTNRKSITRFPTSYRWSAYVIPKSPKGLLKKRFFAFYRATNSAVYAVIVCLSVRPSVCHKSEFYKDD